MPIVTFDVKRPSDLERRAYLRLGLKPPGPSGHSYNPWTRVPVLFVPIRWRWFHRLYATLNGYYWLPCPRCGRDFGGHEVRGHGLPDPKYPEGFASRMICVFCSIELTQSEVQYQH